MRCDISFLFLYLIYQREHLQASLLVGRVNLAVIDLLNNVVRIAAVDGATNALSGAEHFLDGTGQLAGLTPATNRTRDGEDVVEGNIARVLDVLNLLTITRRLLEGSDDERGRTRNHVDGRLTILNGQSHGDFESLPVLGGLGDIISDLLGRKTERTNLRGKRRSGTDFTTDNAEED